MTLDEIAKLNKMVHPELEGACAICGIDPQAIKQLINQARIDEQEKMIQDFEREVAQTK